MVYKKWICNGSCNTFKNITVETDIDGSPNEAKLKLLSEDRLKVGGIAVETRKRGFFE
jgi:hypothetical protein